MIRPLALLHRRLRRLYYGLLAVTAATMLIHVALGALGIGFRRSKQMPMDLTMDLTMAARFAVGGLTVLVLLAIVVVYLLKGWHNERATELLVLSDAKGPKFVAPSSMTRFALSPFFIAGVLALESSMAFATASSRGREFVSWILLAFFLLVGIVVLGRGAYRLTLRPEHIELPSMLGAWKVPWARLAAGGALRPGRVDKPIEVRFGEPSRKAHFFSGLVEPLFLADVIRHYAEYPEHRAQIGTPAEYERLRAALGLPSTQTHELA